MMRSRPLCSSQRRLLSCAVHSSADEQQAEIERLANHAEISLAKLIQRANEETGRAQEETQRGEQG